MNRKTNFKVTSANLEYLFLTFLQNEANKLFFKKCIFSSSSVVNLDNLSYKIKFKISLTFNERIYSRSINFLFVNILFKNFINFVQLQFIFDVIFY